MSWFDQLGKLMNQLTGAKESQEQAYNYNSALAAQQQQYAIDAFNMQNEYNTPKAQMERYKEAGLNPVLAVNGTSGGNGTMTNGGSGGSVGVGGGAGSIEGIINAITNMKTATSVRKLNEANADLNTTNAELAPKLAAAEIALKGAQAGSAKAKETYDTVMTQVDKDLKTAQKAEAETTTKKIEKSTSYGGKTMGTIKEGANTAREVLKAIIPGGKWLF